MVKEAMECEVTEVHTDTVARLKDTLLSQEQFQNLGTLFKMFSDPTRLKILSALFQEELCVCDLSELLEMTHSAVSHQLSVLRQNRLIKYRRSGKNIYYSLDDEHIQLIFDAGLSHIMEGERMIKQNIISSTSTPLVNYILYPIYRIVNLFFKKLKWQYLHLPSVIHFSNFSILMMVLVFKSK